MKIEQHQQTESPTFITSYQLMQDVRNLSISHDFVDEQSHIAIINEIVQLINDRLQFDKVITDEQLLKIQQKIAGFPDEALSQKLFKKYPLIIQLLLVLHHVEIDSCDENYPSKIIQTQWLFLAIYIAVVQYHYHKRGNFSNIINRFRLAIFSKSDNKTWIWNELPSLNEVASPKKLIAIFEGLLQLDLIKQRRNQVVQIHKALLNSFFPKIKTGKDKTDNEDAKSKKKKQTARKYIIQVSTKTCGD